MGFPIFTIQEQLESKKKAKKKKRERQTIYTLIDLRNGRTVFGSLTRSDVVGKKKLLEKKAKADMRKYL